MYKTHNNINIKNSIIIIYYINDLSPKKKNINNGYFILTC